MSTRRDALAGLTGPQERRWIPFVAVLAIVASIVACTSVPAPGGTPSASRPAAAAVDQLLAAGIAIVEDEAGADEANAAYLLLTRVQAERLVADIDGGLLGADLDALAPPSEGHVPLSYLLGGWITAAGTPASATAQSWMRLPETEMDWTQAPKIRFPLAVVALFVADMARLVDEEMTRQEGSARTGGTDASALAARGARHDARLLPAVLLAPRTVVVAAAETGPCSTVTNFLAKTVEGLFAALRVTVPPPGGGVFSDIAGVLAQVWNTAVSYAQRVVQGLVDRITQPVFTAIRLAVGVLGVATVALSYLQDERLVINVEPAQTGPDTYRFAVGSETDIRGEFVARTRSLTGQWPPFLVDCAKTAGASLPELIAPGARTSWSVQHYAAPVIVPGPLEGEVGRDLAARLSFVTGRETEEQARGEATWDGVVAAASIPRREINDFLDLGRQQLRAAEQLIVSQVPDPTVRQLVEEQVAKVVDPVADQLEREVQRSVPGIFTLRGSSDILLVKYHLPPEPTPSPSPSVTPTTDPKTQFCSRYRALLTWWWYESDEPAGSQAWAAEIARRFREMRPFAPANLVVAVDVHIGLYDATARFRGPELAREAAPWAAQMPEAVAALDNYCEIRPGEFGR